MRWGACPVPQTPPTRAGGPGPRRFVLRLAVARTSPSLEQVGGGTYQSKRPKTMRVQGMHALVGGSGGLKAPQGAPPLMIAPRG